MSCLYSIMESYAGKPKELVKCEKYLKEIIDDIRRDRDDNHNLFRSRSVYRESDACRNLEKTLSDFFGFAEVRIYWRSSSINALTLPASKISIMDAAKKNVSKIKVHIEIHEELVYFANLNEKELMAVLLHEIGHNMYLTPLKIAMEMLCIVFSPWSLLALVLARGIRLSISEIINFVKRYMPFIYNIFETRNNIYIQISSVMRPVGLVSWAIDVAKNIGKGGVLTPIKSVIDYGDERGADTLTAKYGYGPEQATALEKIQKASGTLGGEMRQSAGTLGDISNDIYSLGVELISGISMDPHPNNTQRAAVMLKKLERDYAKGDYPPELKKDLEAEIKRMRKIYQTMNENKGNVQIKKGWYDMLNKITDGHTDLREIFDAFYVKYEF